MVVKPELGHHETVHPASGSKRTLATDIQYSQILAAHMAHNAISWDPIQMQIKHAVQVLSYATNFKQIKTSARSYYVNNKTYKMTCYKQLSSLSITISIVHIIIMIITSHRGNRCRP